MKNIYLFLGVMVVIYICSTWILPSLKPVGEKSIRTVSVVAFPADFHRIMTWHNFSNRYHSELQKQNFRASDIGLMTSKQIIIAQSSGGLNQDSIPVTTQLDGTWIMHFSGNGTAIKK